MPERNEISSEDQPSESDPDIIDATDEGDYKLQENEEGVFEFVKKKKLKLKRSKNHNSKKVKTWV